MKELPQIPAFLKHRPIDQRGYLVPYFVGKKDGQYDFRFPDLKKRELCIEKKLCCICGKKIKTNNFYFISGKIGMANRISSDTAMHRRCAEFSLQACPHLLYKNAKYRDTNLPEGNRNNEDVIIKNKPDVVCLVLADKFKTEMHKMPNGSVMKYIIYRYVSHDEYVYEDGILTVRSRWGSDVVPRPPWTRRDSPHDR